MSTMTSNLAFYGYGVAAALFLGISLLVLLNWQGRVRGALLALATLTTTVWAAGLAYSEIALIVNWFLVLLLELGRDASWLLFLSIVLHRATGGSLVWFMRFGGPALVFAFLGVGILSELGWLDLGLRVPTELLTFGSLITSLAVLIYLEQIYRNARQEERKGLKYFCIGAGGVFVYDVVLYSDALVAGRISDTLWSVRGFVVAMCTPLLAMGVRHIKEWSGRIFVSRHVIFYTTTLLAAGTYLVAVGIAGYYVRMIGGQWGSAIQALFVAAAVLGLVLLLFSDVLRAKLRVFISKHFFENKYDYREEWLRLISTLTVDEELRLEKRAIKALAQILGSPAGRLWVRSTDGDDFEGIAGWNVDRQLLPIPANSPLAAYLGRTGWMIDTAELDLHPERYKGLHHDDLSNLLDDLAFIVPLMDGTELFGFVALARTSVPGAINYEDRDLLKTAGKQIASYLGQARATDQLSQNRQFEAFNKLTAYIMHDLKNLISQQSLVVENARKHKTNPEFVDDAVATIESGVQRMRRVIDQLQQTSPQGHREKIDLNKLVAEAVQRCSDKAPVPVARTVESPAIVLSDKDLLLMALCHTIRNAQEATPADGEVSVEVQVGDGECRVNIRDSGRGMDESFVRERLFRPFDSTKGTQGMGIGAYQVRETIRSSGGRVEVESAPGQGTRFTLVIGRMIQAGK
jgi:putative PEP-CTERM system histidine kinase